MKIRIHNFLLAVILLFTMQVHAEAVDISLPTSIFYAADFAEILSDTTEKYIVEQNDVIFQENGIQIVVVTVHAQDLMIPQSDYAKQLYDTWGIGQKTANKGLLLLVNTGASLAELYGGDGLSEESKEVLRALPLTIQSVEDSVVSTLFEQIYSVLRTQYGNTAEQETQPGFLGMGVLSLKDYVFMGIILFFVGSFMVLMIIRNHKTAAKPGRRKSLYQRPIFQRSAENPFVPYPQEEPRDSQSQSLRSRSTIIGTNPSRRYVPGKNYQNKK